MKLVQVEWVDSRQPTSHWERLDDLSHLAPCACMTVGYLVVESDTHVVIAHSIGDDGENPQGTGLTAIPSECIKKMTELVAKPGHPPALAV